jgi:hypothetical protein
MLAGMYTGVELAKYLVPCGSLNMLSEVWKVSDTLALEPVARTRNGEPDGTTFRPLSLRYLATACWAAGVGTR